jgi:Ca2+-binding EF-hand superfamily protein
MTLKKELTYARDVFRFFDKNHDWKIGGKELKKVKISNLATYIASGGKRRK